MVEEVATQETQETKTQEKPEYVPEKFWNKDLNEVNVEELSASYNSLEKKLGARTDELSKQVREDIEKEKRAKVPEKYEITKPELEEGVDVDINADMPLLQWWQKTAKDNGLTQEQFDDGIKAFINNEVDGLPSLESEKEILGENATARIEAAELWSKKNLSTEAYETMSRIANTANGVKLVEEIMKLNKDAPIPTTETAIEAAPSLNDLRSMMQDKRYWLDKDPAYIEKVSNLYEKYYGNKKEAEG